MSAILRSDEMEEEKYTIYQEAETYRIQRFYKCFDGHKRGSEWFGEHVLGNMSLKLKKIAKAIMRADRTVYKKPAYVFYSLAAAKAVAAVWRTHNRKVKIDTEE